MINKDYNFSRRLIALTLLASSMIFASSATTINAEGKPEISDNSVLQSNTVNVIIDDIVQRFEQPPLIINGSTMVPMRAIFESLGARIDWNEYSRSVIGTKENKTIKITVDSSTAYIDNLKVGLEVAPVIINDTTMVPLRFVSEALGASVGWDQNTYTVNIKSAGVGSGSATPSASVTPAPATATPTPAVTPSATPTTTPTATPSATPTAKPTPVATASAKPGEVVFAPAGSEVVKGIKVDYGKHTYGVKNQAEYDKVMEIVKEALKGYDKDVSTTFSDGKYFERYLNGERWDGNFSNKSLDNRGLKSAENRLSDLLNAGVSKDEIIKLMKIYIIAEPLITNHVESLEGGSSAYTTLTSNISDCQGDSQVISALFDTMGYSTAIIANGGDAKAIVKIGDNWFTPVSGSFVKATLPTITEENGSNTFLFIAPTY